MQSKQQKQIKVFLIQTFGGSRGGSLFSRQEKILDRLIKTAANRSKNQMKTLVQTILPRIALYKVLQAELPAEETFTHMRTYMMDWWRQKSTLSRRKMESVPGFYRDLQLLFSQNHAYLRPVGEHTGTRQNALFRVDYQVSLAHGVPGKRLSGAVSAVLRRG